MSAHELRFCLFIFFGVYVMSGFDIVAEQTGTSACLVVIFFWLVVVLKHFIINKRQYHI